MRFTTVAAVFDSLAHLSGRNDITKTLAGLLIKATPEEAQIISYMSMGLLRAPYHGTHFTLAEKSIVTIIAQFLGYSVDHVRAQAPLWGDLGRAYQVLSENSMKEEESLSLFAVYQELCELESIAGNGSAEKRSLVLQDLLGKLSPLSGNLVIRIILGKLRLGFSDMTLLDALSWSLVQDKSLHGVLEQAYNLCADIGLIAFTVKKEGIDGVKAVTLHLGIPLRPAAAERASSAEQVIKRLGTCAAEPKVDGFRLQIHKKGDRLYFFSRNLLDMSSMFPEIAAEMSKSAVENCIIEGEAVMYDPHTGLCLPFQRTITRKRKHDIDAAAEEFPLTFFIFDIIYANGKSFLDCSQQERRNELVTLFGEPHEGILTVIPQKIVSRADDLHHYFESAIAAGFEGLVCKKIDSYYQAGKRNFNWIKLKRSQGTRMNDSIDAVILGYYTGKGRRTVLGIGAFLVGAYDHVTDTYKTIAKVGTGLSDNEWRALKEQCDQFAVSKKPSQVVCPESLTPSVWVIPTLVCEIEADEITVSPLHSASFALRFPRFISIRRDKEAQDSTSLAELASLYKLGLGL